MASAVDDARADARPAGGVDPCVAGGALARGRCVRGRAQSRGHGLMPRVQRSADVSWSGDVARGGGTITAATGAFSRLPFSLPTRIGDAADKTSPEELLAAAHAGCYAMSLAGELAGAGSPVEQLEVRSTVTLD